jgi:hypothetical protein
MWPYIVLFAIPAVFTAIVAAQFFEVLVVLGVALIGLGCVAVLSVTGVMGATELIGSAASLLAVWSVAVFFGSALGNAFGRWPP